jgi:hypothetical protein
MHDARSELIEYWNNEEILNAQPFIHPHDAKDGKIHIHGHYSIKNYSEVLAHQDFGRFQHKMHFGLTPEPYVGDIRNAKVFILLLNPGFSVLDYYGEENEELRISLKNNLYQTFENSNLC